MFGGGRRRQREGVSEDGREEEVRGRRERMRAS